MFSPAELPSADRESANQARALSGLQETLRRHPRARINGRVARTQRRSVVGDSHPNDSQDGFVKSERSDGRLPVPRPRITDRVIRRRHRSSSPNG